MVSSKKKTVLIILALVVVVGLLAGAYLLWGPKTTSGKKEVTINVMGENGMMTFYKLETEAETLQEAMDEAASQGLTYSGSEGDFGLMVDTVNGVRADYTLDGAYWSFIVNGEDCNYGIATQPVNDGDIFTIAYTPAS